MVRGQYRSRTFRRVKLRTPGGRNIVHYEKKKPARAQCANCGSYLHGVAQGNKTAINKLSKTQRRPERPYAGVLCSPCTRNLIKSKARITSH